VYGNNQPGSGFSPDTPLLTTGEDVEYHSNITSLGYSPGISLDLGKNHDILFQITWTYLSGNNIVLIRTSGDPLPLLQSTNGTTIVTQDPDITHRHYNDGTLQAGTSVVETYLFDHGCQPPVTDYCNLVRLQLIGIQNSTIDEIATVKVHLSILDEGSFNVWAGSYGYSQAIFISIIFVPIFIAAYLTTRTISVWIFRKL